VVTTIDETLADLGVRLAGGEAPLTEMRDATGAVAGFVPTLARLSKHAQLLAVNASIEAAHLADGGSRFEIVAQEVRKLSISTGESKADVTRIAAELAGSTGRIAVAVAAAVAATAEVSKDSTRAGASLKETRGAIGSYSTQLGALVALAAEHGEQLDTLTAVLGTLVRDVDDVSVASRNAANGEREKALDRAAAIAERWAADGDAAQRIGADADAMLREVASVTAGTAADAGAWESVRGSLGRIRSQAASLNVAHSAAAASAAAIAANCDQLRGATGTAIQQNFAAALGLIDGSMSGISRITESLRGIEEFVTVMSTSAERADRIMELIETLTSETDLLSLNAAIEAEHAGDQGRGFGIIAEEIRSLARSTNESTVSVSQRVSRILAVSGLLQESIAAASARALDVISGTERAQTSTAELSRALGAATQTANDVYGSGGELAPALAGIAERIERGAAAIDAAANSLAAADRSELRGLESRVRAIVERSLALRT
jgi:methyl-accepting chemotaxis protein